MVRLVWVWIFAFALATFATLRATASEDAFNIGKFYERADASQRMLLKIGGNEKPTPVIILLDDSVTFSIMQIFHDDICVTSTTSSGQFTAYFDCLSGAEMKISYTCRNTCYMRGQHTKKGSWTGDYKYSINQNLSLDEILEFVGQR